MNKHRTFHGHQPLLLALLGASLLASGCGNVSQLHVSDRSTPSYAARVLHRFGSAPGGGGLELQASSQRAQGTQQLLATDLVTLSSASIAGPVQLAHKVQSQHAHVVYNHLLFAGRPIELEWFAGAAWTNARWDITSANPADARLSNKHSWYGPTGGVVGRVRMGPLLALEARVSGATNLLDDADTGTRRTFELALAFRPAPALVLRGGLSEERSFMRPESTASELSLRARGPFLNLGLEF